jgi:hypothetical protein
LFIEHVYKELKEALMEYKVMFVHKDNTITFAKEIDYKFKLKNSLDMRQSKIDISNAEEREVAIKATVERETNTVKPEPVEKVPKQSTCHSNEPVNTTIQDDEDKSKDKDKQNTKEKEGNNDDNKKEEEKVKKAAYADTGKEIEMKNIKYSI